MTERLRGYSVPYRNPHKKKKAREPMSTWRNRIDTTQDEERSRIGGAQAQERAPAYVSLLALYPFYAAIVIVLLLLLFRRRGRKRR